MKPLLILTCFLTAVLGFAPPASAAEGILQARDNVKITLQRNRSVSDIKSGSIGAKSADFEPVVKIQNGTFSDFKGNKVRVLIMGEDTTQKNNWRVIYARDFSADLLAGKTFEWTGEPFTQAFDRTLAKSGYDYDGYIVLIRNAEGNLATTAASKTIWLADPERAWTLEEGKEYSRASFKK